jgi:hypothetical protein
MNINYTPDNTFIFSFVRMNPPTPGHMSLVGTMIHKAIELGSNKVYIITSSTLNDKNPLPCNRDTMDSNLIYKSYVLDKMISVYKQQLMNTELDENIKSKIENMNVIVTCSSGNTFSFINSIINRDFINKGINKVNMFFIVGRDRANFLDQVVDIYKKNKNINSINGIVLAREGMEALKNTGIGTRSITDIDPSEYSASFIRNLVKNNSYDDFIQVYSPYLSKDETDKLYETIKIATQMKVSTSKNKNEKSKKEDENPISIYFDNNKLPIIVSSSGGKKYRKTKKKLYKTRRRKNKNHTRR